jgi:transposase
MNVTTIGIDLAKDFLQIHGVNQYGKAVVRKQLKRAQVAHYFANLPACLIGMEACGSAHFWARKLTALGHTVKLMAPQFVKPYVKTNKNDASDAEAICEAVSRPSMRFVSPKSAEQQALLALHRARAGFVQARTAQGNQIRGLLAEFGFVVPKGQRRIEAAIKSIVEDAENGLPGMSRELFVRLLEHLGHLDAQAKQIEEQIKTWHQNDADSRRLETIPGIGPITASALVASIADIHAFKNARQLAAWLGLVPRQHSTGGKQVLLGISKRGDAYLRTLLIHGGRSVPLAQKRKTCAEESWSSALANLKAAPGATACSLFFPPGSSMSAPSYPVRFYSFPRSRPDAKTRAIEIQQNASHPATKIAHAHSRLRAHRGNVRRCGCSRILGRAPFY